MNSTDRTTATAPGDDRASRGLLARLDGRIGLRMRTWWRARELDHALACGGDPDASDELALRKRQLGSRASRDRLAASLETAVDDAFAGPGPLGVRVSFRRNAVRDSSESLLELAERLRGDDDIDPRGIAMVRMLTSDAASPLYWERASHSLADDVETALSALEPESGSRVEVPRPV
jgi:hypothetical protein